MSDPNWTDGGDNWTTGSDWSSGVEPSSTDNVLIDQGVPLIDTNVGTVNSLTIADDGALSIAGGGALTVAGNAYVAGAIIIDDAAALGQSGNPGAASLTVDGLLVNLEYIVIGSKTQTVSDTVTVANFVNGGDLELAGSATNAATLHVLGSANPLSALGLGAAEASDDSNLLTGDDVLTGDALLEFGSGQFTGIAQYAALSISGTDAFVADASNTASDSALDLSSNDGTLALDNGASLTTAAGFVNEAEFGSIVLANDDDVSTTTTLIVDNTTAGVENSAGALDSHISVSGNSLLEFEGGGQIASIAEGGSLSLSGANAFVADIGALTSNSAIGALTSNAGGLSLDDGVSLTTAAGFTEGDDATLSLGNDDNAATATTLVVNNTTAGFEDSTGALDTNVSVSGNSLLEFEQGDQIAGIGEFSTLSLSGAHAFIAEAGQTTSNSALELSSNAGNLELDDGASLTTAAGFTDTGYVGLRNDDNATTATTLFVNNTTAAFEDSTGVFDDRVSVSDDSQLVFDGGGQIASIGAYATLSLSGPNAFIADAGATTSDSALNLTSNAGQLELDDGASLTTAAGFTDTGYIGLGNDDDATTTTKLVVGNSTAGFGNSPGVLDDAEINITGNSVLEFEGGGQFTSIGGDGFLSLDGAGAYVEDASAPNSNSAIAALTSNSGYLGLDDGATLTTSATFVDTGSIYLGTYSSTTATSKLVAGSATNFAPSGTFTGLVELGNNALLEFAGGGEITGIAVGSEIGVDGTTAFIADPGNTTSNSALSGLASNAGTLELDAGASVTTTGALNNTGEIDLSDPMGLDQESPSEPVAEFLTTPATSVLDIASEAGLGIAQTITGTVKLGNDSLLEFMQGEITTLDDDASLSIDGPSAFIADADDTSSNSALKGLASLLGGSTLKLGDGASVATTGGLSAADDSNISLADGASLTIDGALTDIGGAIELSGDSAIATTLDINASAGFGTLGTVTNSISLSGNSLLEFAENQITTIAASGELVIDGDNAFVADESAPTSNSALAGLDDVAGDFSLEAGASVTTTGQLKSTGDVVLADAATLVVTGDAAKFGNASGDLEGELEVSDGSLLEFTEGGQIAGIASGATLSISGTNAYVADGGEATSSTALAGLAVNAGTLDLDDGATITTTGALANTGAIFLGDDYSTSTAVSTLDVGGSAEDFGPSGALLGDVELAGHSLLEFHGGQITSIGSSGSFSFATLSIDGTSAFVAEAGETTSNSALAGLDDISGELTLDGGASVTTNGALNNAGIISLGSQNDSPGGPVTTLAVGSAAGLGAAGVMNGYVTLSGNSLLEFQSDQITTISSSAYLSIRGTNAFVADMNATGSNSALAGLDDNAGILDLDDGATISTTVALTNSGEITLNQNAYSSAITTLYVGASAATFQSTGVITLDNNSLLEFASDEITTIGYGSKWFIDGANAFVADKGATTSSSALTGLDDIAGFLYLEGGASVTTNGSLDDAGYLYVEGGSNTPGSTLTVKGTLNVTDDLVIGDTEDDATPSTLNATALTLTNGFATIDADGAVNVDSLTLVDEGLLDVEADASAISSAITFAAGAAAFLELGVNAVASTGGSFAKAIDGFSAGDTIELKGLTYVEGSTTATLNGTTLTVTNGTTTDTLTLIDAGGTNFQTAADLYGGGADITVTCFASGTRIRTTPSPGVIVDVAVESLAVGDRVVTASGQARPIRWLGHRTVDCRRHPRPAEVMPVRVAAHAFGPDRPARELYVSPGHAIGVDVVGEVLIPACELVNGATIQQIEADEITYWHVELDSHDLLLAENLPTESYLDMGNRGFFAESGIVDLAADPDPVRRSHADFCRPYHCGDGLVEVVRAQLFSRARSLGWTLRHDPLADLHLVVDGFRIDAVVRYGCVRFTVPAGAQEVSLGSDASRPTDVGRGSDRRTLGVCVLKISIDDGFAPARELPLEDPALDEGFHPLEQDGARSWRWTKGPARLPAALSADYREGFFLRLDHDGDPMPKWIAPCGEMVASELRPGEGRAGARAPRIAAE